MSNKIENREKLIKILTEMFQFDQADLDFGIYRIMNQKRDRIEEFMNKELFSKIEKSIEPLKSNINQSKVSKIENKISTLDSMNDDGSFDNKIMELKEEMEEYISSFKTDGIESEVYSHLTDFFRRYYDEGDFISQRRYKDGVYAIPYEGEEVKLHWANYDQYYIKSSEYFYDYTFKTSFGEKINFKLLDVEVEKDNNKGDRKTFQIIKDMENNPESIDDELYIYFKYVEDRSTQKKRNEESVIYLTEKINSLKLLNYEPMLRQEKRGVSSEIEKQINRYTARNTYDYFIHKDLEKFLTRELNFYIKNEVLHLENMNPEETGKLKEYITKAKVIESVANTVITFLSQLEEFQKALWLKKKFIVNTNYAITLDKVDEKFYSKIISNNEQIEEWIKLFVIDELDDYSESLTIEFLENNPYLMVDTKFFDNTFKEELIGSIDNLDESIDGVLINSDNFHALNLIQERYREKIDCVYIDPPYNTDGDGFLYKDSYRESSWLSMMFDRIKMSKTIQSSDSVNFQSIGNEEYDSLSMLNKILFDNPEKRNVIHWKKNQKPQNASGTISESAEYILVNFGTKLKKLKRAMSGTREDDKGSFKPSPLFKFDGRERRVQVIPKGTIVEAKIWEKGKLSGVRNKLAYIEILDEPNVINGILQNDVRIKGEWTKTDTYGEYSKMVSEGRLFINSNGFPNEKAYRDENSFNVHTNLWTEFGYNEKGKELLDNLFGVSDIIKYPKPVELLNEVVRCSTENNSIILDYFAGSGTTPHAVINLNREDDGNRKYILVEMGEYFDTVTKPRIQKVVYSEDWKEGKPVSRKGSSHAFKYFSLESYEDALNNIIFENDDMFRLLPGDSSVINEYIISYMLFEETKESKCLLNIDEMKNPFDYKMKIVEKGEQKEKKVDLIETFNYLIGLKVLRNHSIQTYDADFSEGEYGKISATIAPGTTYKFKTIEGILPTGENALVVWRNTTGDSIKDNEVLNTFLNEKIIKISDVKYDVIYVNGDNFIKNINLKGDLKVKLIEVEMKRKMFEEVVI